LGFQAAGGCPCVLGRCTVAARISGFHRTLKRIRILPIMIGWILTRPLALLTGVVGGAAASQVPTFQNAYLTYLQGRVDEANRTAQIAQQELSRAMETMGVASEEALKTAVEQSEGMAAAALQSSITAWDSLVERAAWLQATITDMTSQQAFERLIKLPLNLRPEFVQGTLRNFEMGIAFTLESAVMVLSAALLAYFIARLVARLFWRLVRPKPMTPQKG